MEVEILHPQHSTIDAYCSSGHSRTISSVHEMYDRLEGLIEDSVTWCIIPSDAKPFAIFFNDSDMQLIVLLGHTVGVEYHSIHVIRQFGFCQDTFEQIPMPEFFQLYLLSSTVMATELSCLLQCVIHLTNIAMMKGSSFTMEYEAQIRENWPIREVLPGPPLFPDVGSSKRV